jgi:hypothetical protein
MTASTKHDKTGLRTDTVPSERFNWPGFESSSLSLRLALPLPLPFLQAALTSLSQDEICKGARGRSGEACKMILLLHETIF